MEIIFKKTNELSTEEKLQICDLFQCVFKRTKSLEMFEKQFLRTCLGHSYHGLMVDTGKIVGSSTAVPFKYKYFSKEYVFALGVDAMIDKKYRNNLSNLKKMEDLVCSTLIADGVPFIFGFPNDKVNLLRIKMLGWAEIGKLDYYALPIKIGASNKLLKALNVFSLAFAKIINYLPKSTNLIHGVKGDKFNIEKVNDAGFLNNRYDHTHKIVRINDKSYFVYKIGMEGNIKLAYLIDVFPMGKQLLESSVKYIFQKEKNHIDAIAYLGKLSFTPINIYKIPNKLTPGVVHLSGKVLIDTLIDNRIYDINNWDVNLSNFDVR